ncbi:hypothetical protein [Kordiimonas sp.]|uniref:hypothetical protein n=1 Tax=Kordiimonas sp. TaxID=1970157 RepID=UPI003A931FC1
MKIAIGETLEASVDLVFKNLDGLLNAAKWPFVAVVVLFIISTAAGELLDISSFRMGFRVGAGMEWPISWLVFLVLNMVVASLAVAVLEYKWQRFILLDYLPLNEAARHLPVRGENLRGYLVKSLALMVPWFVYLGSLGPLASVVMTTGNFSLLFIFLAGGILFLPIYMRAALVLPAQAAGLDNQSIWGAFQFGKGNGWRIASATMILRLVVGITAGIVYFITIIPITLFAGLFAMISMELSLVMVALLAGLCQSIFLVFFVGMTSGLQALAYAQLHPDYDDPLRVIADRIASEKVSVPSAVQPAEEKMSEVPEPPKSVEMPTGPVVVSKVALSSSSDRPLEYGRRKGRR